MPLEGVDFSYDRPGAAALMAAGKRFVVRYITGAGKALTAAEIADYHAHSIAIALVFESTRGRVLGGELAGIADATTALAACIGLRIPNSTRIYFAVDFDAQPDQQPAIDAYLRGAASILGAGRVGVYGGIHVLERCRANGSAAGFWQTYAWSGGQVAPFIHLYQYRNHQTINGAAVDLCRAYRPDFGQWPRPAIAAVRYRVVIDGPVRLYTRIDGTVLGAVTKASYTCTKSRVPAVTGRIWYRIVEGKRTGQALRANRHMTVRAIA